MNEPPLYQVLDWQKHYENAKSRGIKDCSFVCQPNKQGGVGLMNILVEQDGGCIYGVWCLIVGLCSRQNPPRSGYLTANGERTGRRLRVTELAYLFRRTEKEVTRCLEVITSPDVGWMRVVPEEELALPEPSQDQNTKVSAADTEVSQDSDARNTVVSAGAPLVSQTGESQDTEVSSRARAERKKERTEEPPSVPQGGQMSVDETKAWVSKLFGRERAWAYDELELLSRLMPIAKEDRALISWAYTLPIDREGWAMVQGFRASKRKDNVLTLLRDFASEIDKWRSVRSRFAGVQKKNGAEPLPPEWANVMRRLYGKDIPIPALKEHLSPSVRDEIEKTIGATQGQEVAA